MDVSWEKSRPFVYFLVRTEAVAVKHLADRETTSEQKTKQTDEKVLKVEKIAVQFNSPINLWTEGLNINFRTELGLLTGVNESFQRSNALLEQKKEQQGCFHMFDAATDETSNRVFLHH